MTGFLSKWGCVMSPRLFNIYMNGAVREVNAGMLCSGLMSNDGRVECESPAVC